MLLPAGSWGLLLSGLLGRFDHRTRKDLHWVNTSLQEPYTSSRTSSEGMTGPSWNPPQSHLLRRYDWRPRGTSCKHPNQSSVSRQKICWIQHDPKVLWEGPTVRSYRAHRYTQSRVVGGTDILTAPRLQSEAKSRGGPDVTRRKENEREIS